MQKQLSYLTPDGHTVFTSQFLKNRGTCCKSACLHCPYGYTLKKCGLQFRLVTETDKDEVESILKDSNNPGLDWRFFFPDNILVMVLKGEVCGLLLKNHIVIKHIALRPQFQNQDLSRDMVESYLFI